MRSWKDRGMKRRGPRLRTIALVAVAAVLAAGCSGGASPATEPSANRGTPASPTPRSGVRNPFTITNRFDAASLGLDHPIALAIGPDGNLYVTDNSQAVTVISPDGEVLRRWGSGGKGQGEFSFVSTDPSDPQAVHAAIAVGPDGQVYVSDSGNYRVEVFSATGTFIREFGSFGTKEGQLLAPFDLVADRDGNVYVADDSLATVSKFSPTGDFIWGIGGALEGDPDLVGHKHLASIDSQGRIVMANDDIGRILYVDAKGHKVDAFGRSGDFPGGACNVTVDAADYTFVNSCGLGETQVFHRNHELIGGWYGPDNPLGICPLFGPNGEVFALGQDGAILGLAVALPKG